MKKLFFFLLFSAASICSSSLFSQQLTPLSLKPDWSLLKRYAQTITAPQLEELLERIYVPDGSWKNWITIKPEQALIQPYSGAAPEKIISLPLAASNEEEKPWPRYWKKPEERTPKPGKPLAGLKIVIDPGHLGGSWAKMEERWFHMGHSRSVEEGTMTLITAKILAARLIALGANVMLTRNHLGPTTPVKLYQLRKAALTEFAKTNERYTKTQLQKMKEVLFYRVAEIHHRAGRINHDWRPDLVICLHFNAEDWNDPKHPTLSDNDHLHLLISGDFSDAELQNEDVRYTMLCKLLSRAHSEEVDLSNDIAQELAMATGLQPFVYHNPAKARSASPCNPYLWNRNLLATRLYECPVIYCEPYVMNNADIVQRVQFGDYSGYRRLHEKKIPSIYREYADAVAKGVKNYFGK
ncbi:MAG: hypothetical protein ACH346_05790 [Chthoniobacterales bacterium]